MMPTTRTPPYELPAARRRHRAGRATAMLSGLLALGAVLAGCGPVAGPAATRVAAIAEPASGTARSAEGAPLAYAVRGRGEVAVVLIHGWNCDSSYWDAQLDALAPQYRVVTLDLAGHGRSGQPARRWSVEEFGDDVARVVDALGLRRVVLVGHSLGGPVAIEAARRLGERALGVIGVDTLQQLGPLLPPDQLEARIAPFRQDFAGTVRGFVLGSFFVPQSDPALKERIASGMAAARPDVAIPALLGLNDWYARAPAARFDRPVVLLNAAQPPVNRAQVAATFPRLEVRTFEGVGHFLMMEAPGPFNAALLEELAELRAAAATR